MPIPARLSSYLDQRGTRYEIHAHRPSRCSAETARVAQVLPRQLAKSVMLEDDTGCVMVVVPADKTVMLGHLSQLLGRKALHLSDENRIALLFEDCDRGAVPAVGMAWGIETLVDDELETSEGVYMESGDHQRLLHMSHEQFHELMSAARHGHFCKTPLH
ncbi:YbaK/EbsC family protein [Polaromonas sp.]|uniref:aminoacyl-tRNA deacylase n=1 Tax=Polaromonas sp. TaxID=1869339 RepID=UPI00286A6447|nr:YbaK/EbsC family protein [Polaromonas sp.]